MPLLINFETRTMFRNSEDQISGHEFNNKTDRKELSAH
jgi:hypothetical protein